MAQGTRDDYCDTDTS